MTAQGCDWRDLSLEELRIHNDGLFFLTTEGFAYYLPAFLRVSLAETKAADIIPDSVCYSLNPPKKDGWALDEFKKRVSLFTPAQRTAIIAFLGYAETHLRIPEARRALHRFWNPPRTK
jgi:hypothetical protein